MESESKLKESITEIVHDVFKMDMKPSDAIAELLELFENTRHDEVSNLYSLQAYCVKMQDHANHQGDGNAALAFELVANKVQEMIEGMPEINSHDEVRDTEERTFDDGLRSGAEWQRWRDREDAKQWLESRISELKSQVDNPEVLDQNRIDIKIDVYNEILSHLGKEVEGE